jgi:predicted PurR-regulated permease PerM
MDTSRYGSPMPQPLAEHVTPDPTTPESIRWLGWVIVSVATGVLLIIVTRNVFVAASGVLAWALASVVTAVLVSPVVSVVARAMPRALAIVLVFLALGFGGIALRSIYVNELRDQVDFLVERGPEVGAEIEARDDQIGDAARQLGLVDRVTELVDRLDENVGSRGDAFKDTAMAVPAYVVAFILSIFFMVFGPATLAAGIERLGGEQQARVDAALRGAARSTQRQVGAAIASAVMVGAIIWLAGRALGIPAPGLFALAAAIAATVPYVGIVAGSLPVLVAGFGVAPVWQVGVVAAAVVALQFVEAAVWRPYIDHRSLYVGPAVPVIAGAIGYAIYGPGGAVVLIVVAVFALAIVDEVASDDDLPTPIDEYHEPADDASSDAEHADSPNASTTP